jgi:hypothetical protein
MLAVEQQQQQWLQPPAGAWQGSNSTTLPDRTGAAVGFTAVANPAVSSSSNGRSSNGSSSSAANYTLWDLYCEYWKPFGDVLTQMEQDGVRVNRCGASSSSQFAVTACIYCADYGVTY